MKAMIRELLDWLHAATGRLMSRCRVCGSRADVIMYDPRGLWAYFFRQTWCPPHCPDHDYIYSRGDGHYCNNCGQQPDYDWHADRFD
jgi:hypothetical protein